MTNKKIIWIWIQNDKIFKAISCVEDGTIKIYNEDDNLILKRMELTKFQVKQAKQSLLKYGAKRLNKNSESFKFY